MLALLLIIGCGLSTGSDPSRTTYTHVTPVVVSISDVGTDDNDNTYRYVQDLRTGLCFMRMVSRGGHSGGIAQVPCEGITKLGVPEDE